MEYKTCTQCHQYATQMGSSTEQVCQLCLQELYIEIDEMMATE